MCLLKKLATRSDISCTTLLIFLLAAGFCSKIKAEEMPSGETIVFTTVVYPTHRSETNALLLIESIRDFGGALAESPIWCLTPQPDKHLSMRFMGRITELGVTIVPLDIDSDVLHFFFAGDIHAAAVAESMAIEQTDLLVWLSSNTIVLQEPTDFLLAQNKSLGYRPVHHINIGSLYDSTLDFFWTLVYQYCRVPEDRIFPMQTHVDGLIIRPYFNAGIVVTRPEKHLFRAWRELFFDVYQKPKLKEIYEQDQRYRIFAHQAILSGIILSNLTSREMQELPRTYNYPLHLYDEDATDHRPDQLDELITIRHEGFYQDPKWKDKMPASDSLIKWLADRVHR